MTALLLVMCSNALAEGPVYAFTGANVLPMNEELAWNDVTVIVENGIVTAIAPPDEISIPEEAVVIDASGRWIMPGLSDMHTHLGLRLPGEPEATYRELKADLGNFLPNGVTKIRNMRGNPDVLRLRREIALGQVTGPRIFTAGPSLNENLPESFGPNITTPGQARLVVEDQVEQGYDLIKVHQALSDEAFFEVISTAHEHGVKVAGHAQSNGEAEKSLALDSLEHSEELDELIPGTDTFDQHPAILKELLDSGTVVVPTLSIFSLIPEYLSDDGLQRLLAQDQTRFVSGYWMERMGTPDNFFRQAFGPDYAELIPSLQSDYKRLKQITAQIHEAGVPIALGTDSVGLLAPGFSVHQELEVLVETGLSPYEALSTATRNAAILLGVENRLGTLFVGAEADLILLEANPLDDIRNSRRILGVMANGLWLEKTTLEQMLVAADQNSVLDE